MLEEIDRIHADGDQQRMQLSVHDFFYVLCVLDKRPAPCWLILFYFLRDVLYRYFQLFV